MKRLLAILLTAVLVISIISTDAFVLDVNAATSGTTGNCTWKRDGTVLTISGRGTMNDYGLGGSNLPWGTSITKVIISWGVTNIGAYAFSGCNRLTCIEIPNSVTSIGHDAFRNCTGLTSINIPDSVENIGNYAFYGCKGLTSIKFPACVTGIGDYAFSDCTGLTSINIPASGANMGAYAFYGCKGLTSINISGRLMNIKEGAFCACTGLTSIKLPVSVTKIGSDAFRSCTSLCDIWYTGEDRIGISIGTGNACLTEATWHYNTCVDEHTYFVECDSTCNNCDWIRSVSVEQHFPESIFDTETHWKECLICKEMVVTPIEHNYDNACDTVCDCGYTRSITHNYLSRYDSINHWEECSVCHTKQNIEEHTYSNNCDTTCNGCVNIREVSDHAYGEDHICDECGGTVPSGTTGDCKWLIKDKILTISGNGRMGDYTSSAPYMKYDFDKVVIGDGVTSIGDSAFQGCSGLTNIEIPNSVTSIGWYAFSGCSNLISIEIPKGVISISGYMFYDCSSLTRITLSATYIAGWAFYGCSRLAEVRYQGSKTALIVSERGNDALTTAVWSFNTSDVVSSGTTGNCEWSIEGRTLTISGNGAMGNYSSDSTAPYLEYDFDKVVILNGVTSIGSSAFENYSGLISIELPTSVINIGRRAFYDCDGLTSIEIPTSVTSIGSLAFYDCDGLTSIQIPPSVTQIAGLAFYGCMGLTRVYISDLAKWCKIEFGNDSANPICYAKELYLNGNLITELEIPTSVTSIGDYAFYNYDGLTSIEIPTSVTSIGDGVFSFCVGLTNIELSTSVTSIGSCAFENCSGLTSIEIPTSVTKIGEQAFVRCSGLTRVYIKDLGKWCEIDFGDLFANPTCQTKKLYLNESLVTELEIPTSVTSIRDWAFYNCDGLTSIEIPTSVTSIGDYAFCSCDGLTSIEIPVSVTSIGDAAFEMCSALTSIKIPDSVTSIGSWAFDNCSGLTTIEIPASVTNIGNYVFCGCSGLTSVKIPPGVTSIGRYTFYQCSGLISIELPTSVTSIGDGAFDTWSELTDVWYLGSEMTKTNIKIGSRNESLSLATWHYNTCKEDHKYLHNCDSSCENCDWVRITTNTVSDEHDFTLNNDLTCQYCGYSKQPNKPIIESKSENTISLVANDIYEYSMDGENWRLGNVFSGLMPGTSYTFYQRVRENKFTLVSEKSAPLIVKTDKGTQSPPAQPTLISKTHDTVTLTLFGGYEYSIDGINWQSSNVFTGLNPETSYLFYQRKAENDRYYASSSSTSLTVKTDEEPRYISGDFNNDNAVTDADALYLLYHTIFGNTYPIEQDCDYNNDGVVTDADALYLLYHTIFGESYPLN